MADIESRQTPDIGASRPSDEGDFCPLPSAQSSGSQTGVQENVQEVAGSAGQTARQMGQQGQQAASDFLNQVGSRLQGLLGSQKDRAAGGLDSIVQALRQASDRLHDEKNDTVASYANSTADQLERLSRSLHEQDLRQMAGRVEDFARRRPELFLGAAFLGGVLLARVLKSSASRDY